MCHFQVPLATGTYWNNLTHTLTQTSRHTHTHTYPQPLQATVCKPMLKNVLFPLLTLFSFFHFTLWVVTSICGERFFVLIHCKCVSLSALSHTLISFFAIPSLFLSGSEHGQQDQGEEKST